ncbi:MAG TPA: DUF6265 family protein [Candidatus Thermoplasmatota archaeon]
MTRRAAAPALGVGVFLVVACVGSGPPSVRIEPIEAAPPGEAPLAVVSFLAGCWRGGSGDGSGTIEERWAPPAGGLMLGTTRFLRDGRAVDFEFGTIVARDGEVVLTPYPRGERSPHAFRLTTRSQGRVVFEAPDHDYPKRILYERLPDEALLARIDGGEADPQPRSWTMQEAPCG